MSQPSRAHASPEALDEIIEDLQRIIDANETTHLLVREASEQLGEALLLHLDDVDELVCALKAKIAAMRS